MGSGAPTVHTSVHTTNEDSRSARVLCVLAPCDCPLCLGVGLHRQLFRHFPAAGAHVVFVAVLGLCSPAVSTKGASKALHLGTSSRRAPSARSALPRTVSGIRRSAARFPTRGW